jgi:uncharacterized metal-binding protein YceD (DUF177 family)
MSNSPPISSSENEFSYIVKLDEIGAGSAQYKIAADVQARLGLMARFDLLALDMLEGEILLIKSGTSIRATGHMRAQIAQVCIASGDSLPAAINVPFDIIFTPEPDVDTDTEIELENGDCDMMFHNGKVIDIGEAVAQTLWLSLDPYPRSPEAAKKLKAAGVKSEDEIERDSGPFGALAALKDKMAKS